MRKKNNAFSLIELSIVIVVVLILIAGVIRGFSMVQKFQLQVARNITKSSPVSSIKDLYLWYETSLETSFKYAEAEDGSKVSTWYDNNPQSMMSYNASMSTDNSKPIFHEAAFPGAIPGIRFDGTDDRMNFDAQGLGRTAYTIFVVEQKRKQSSEDYFLTINCGGGTNGLLHFGYYSETRLKLAHFSNDLQYVDSTTLQYERPLARIHTAMLDTQVGRKYWLNGGDADSPETSDTQKATLKNCTDGRLAFYAGSYYYSGDIGEIIIFTRALKTEERQSIEEYLSKKYQVELS